MCLGSVKPPGKERPCAQKEADDPQNERYQADLGGNSIGRIGRSPGPLPIPKPSHWTQFHVVRTAYFDVKLVSRWRVNQYSCIFLRATSNREQFLPAIDSDTANRGPANSLAVHIPSILLRHTRNIFPAVFYRQFVNREPRPHRPLLTASTTAIHSHSSCPFDHSQESRPRHHAERDEIGKPLRMLCCPEIGKPSPQTEGTSRKAGRQSRQLLIGVNMHLSEEVFRIAATRTRQTQYYAPAGSPSRDPAQATCQGLIASGLGLVPIRDRSRRAWPRNRDSYISRLGRPCASQSIPSETH